MDPYSSKVGFGANSQTGIYPILSIDGGGIRGIIPATLLVEIEKITKKSISQLFRLIGGTSTGGLIALGLTATNNGKTPIYKAQDILDIYTKKHGLIFSENSNYDQNANFQEKIKNPLYQAPTALFKDIFGDIVLSSALTDVVVTANSFSSVISKAGFVGVNAINALASLAIGTLTGQPINIYSHSNFSKKSHLFTKTGMQVFNYPRQIYTSVNKDFYMREVAQITSAAPSYFPPVQEYLDGGILQNNPAIPCIVKALEMGGKKENLFLVSLGTGLSSEKAIAQDFQTLGASVWLQTVQNDIEEEEILQEMLPQNGYHRLQHNFVGQVPSLDAHTLKDIAALKEAGKQLVKDKHEQLEELCRILSPDTFD